MVQFPVIGAAMIIDECYDIYKLNNEIDALPAIVTLMYSIANSDGISNEEQKEIDNYVNKLVDKFSENNKLDNIYKKIILNVNNNDIKEKKLQKIKKQISEIKLNKYNIKLTDALILLIRLKNYKEYAKLTLEKIIMADNHISEEERLIETRIKYFLKAKDKEEAIRVIKSEEKPFLEHYKYKPTADIKRLKNNLIIINDYHDKFENIADLCENEYYIAHPKNSKYLYPLSRLDNIKNDTIDEFINIATKLGALEISYSIERVEDTKTNLKVDVGISGNDGLNTAEVKSETSLNKENYNEFKYTHGRKLNGGYKENRHDIEKKMLWTKGDLKTKNLIESMYSKNPSKEWTEEFYLKSIVNSLDKTLFNGALRIASTYEINIDADIEKQYQSMSEEKIRIHIKFEND